MNTIYIDQAELRKKERREYIIEMFSRCIMICMVSTLLAMLLT